MNNISRNSNSNNNPQVKSSEQKYISLNDFIYFKNELLKDLKSIETKMLSKVNNTSQEEFNTKIINMDSKINSLKTKIFELSSTLNSEKSITDKINKLMTFKLNSEEKISKNEKRIKELSEYLNESIYSMNKLVQETVNYPGVIGLNSKFANFHAFIDFIINNINNFKSFSEKMMALDIQNYKSKLDKVMKSYKVQIDTFMNSTKNLTTDTLVIFDNKIQEILRVFEDKISEEKKDLRNDIDIMGNKFGEVNNIIHDFKSELSNKIGSHDFENERKFANINLKFDKNIYDIESVNKKADDINENIKKICINYEERMKEQEYKLLMKINDLYNIIKINRSSNKTKSNISLKKFERDFEKDIHNFKSPEPGKPIRDPSSIESKLKRYIEGEVNINEIISNRDKKHLKGQNSTNSNDTERNRNKILDSESFPVINNVKFIKFENEAIKNNQENYENKLFLNRKKLDSYIIEKENIIINRVPRKQIIKNLLQGSSEPISNCHIKSQEDKINLINKIRSKYKKQITSIKSDLLSKHKLDSSNSFNKILHKSTSQFYKKKKLDLINNGIDNGDLDDIPDLNKRTFSSLQSRTRNNDQNSLRQNSIMGYNTTDILKETKSKDNKEENNIKYDNNINNNMNNKEILIQDENTKDNEYLKKKNKILHNFNSASKLFDINVQSDNNLLIKTKLKLGNPLHKNIKIIKNGNQTINSKNNKNKDNNFKPSIHYYFNIKNKNK